MLERAALIGPTIVIVGRRDVGGNSRQMRRPGDRGGILRRTHVGAAEHPDLPVRIRKRSRPLHRVVTVLRFVLERIPFSLRCVSPPNVLCDEAADTAPVKASPRLATIADG